ncbi:MAG: NAD+ synthase [Deltaproteobacteria bacterium]|nr:NAD+ synthase [Deltaproteobacteria bacterium]
MKIAILQINTTVGDFKGNEKKILDGISWAEGQGAEMAIFPELAICGYPPRDLLERPSFIDRNIETLERIAARVTGIAAVIGFVSRNPYAVGRGLYNSAAIVHDGRVQFVQHKSLLPEYDVFDEARYFEPAHAQGVHTYKGLNIGLSICEDMWSAYLVGGRRIYQRDPIEQCVREGADVLINISASPFSLQKKNIRTSIVQEAAKRFHRPVIYCNLVGGNDELVFDGHSLAFDRQGFPLHEGKSFEEDRFVVDLALPSHSKLRTSSPDIFDVERALTLGLRDYMQKCGFERAVIGLSGGIDSAVVAAIAAKALGPKRVTGILMSSPYTSKQSVSDALELAKRLKIKTEIHTISSLYRAYRKTLAYTSKRISQAEENIQARIRGNILMAISNSTGAIVLSTGNKSELSVGYCTLYGDMAGGLAVISDLPKTMVYELARWMNREKEVIPSEIIDRPPTAELKPNQTDQDILPPYPVLDQILKAYIEDHKSRQEIVDMGFGRLVVDDVLRRVDRNEYKRRQAAPGLKVTWKAFGIGRRFPIAWKP